MRNALDIGLKNLKWIKIRKKRMSATLMLLSLIVTLNVFWFLRQPGLTLAGDASCGILEHTHDDACGTKVCVCEISEELHVHDESCYETNRIEEYEEVRLECDTTEEVHDHTDDCYETIVSENTEIQLICENQEADHNHEDACYETVITDNLEEKVLVCDLVSEPHLHTDSCYVIETIAAHEEQVLVCDIPETAHVHDDVCYEWSLNCELEEHVHSIDCYSDDTADVETMLDWQEMFADYPYTGNLREDLVGIAKTQVGYTESARNFEVGSDGIRRGYTRYGAWYGTPYRDWSAMFVSFCLNYAGADPEEYPGNTGAASMAELWDKQGKYALADAYSPVSGDLVFFHDNTVGIVSEIQNTTFHVIRGDVDDAVCVELLTLTDESVAGWGITETPEPEGTEATEPEATEATEPEETEATEPEETEATEPEETEATEPEETEATEPEGTEATEPEVTEASEPVETEVTEPEATEATEHEITETIAPETEESIDTEEQEEDVPQEEQESPSEQIGDADILDISDGPAFFLFESGESVTQMQTYSLRSKRSITELLPYLEANGGNYFFTLLDFNNVELPKDENGNYIATANTGYKMTLTFNSPEGFLPGTYQYQIPNGLMVDGGEGTFVLNDGTTVGSWVVTDTGLITLVFNENMNSRTDITISATLGIHFPEQEEPIDFDGKITVTVEPPPDQQYPTTVNKWGNQGGTPDADGTDTSKIYWGLEIIGNKDSQIPGSILTDNIIDGEWSKIHRFTESDIAGGLTIGVSENGNWHSWVVTADDPHLIWTETGWSYKMPQTATCQWCGELELGNEGWYYYIDYTSTPISTGLVGTFGYENEATIDGAYGYAWVNFTHGEITGEITKDGSFYSDASGGGFLWEIQAIIPGRLEGQRAIYSWALSDEMRLLDSNGIVIDRLPNDIHLATVTATYNGATIVIPRIQDATDADMFAWDNAWTSEGIPATRTINLLCRCQCTAETCHWTGCGDYWFQRDDGTWDANGFCQCWTETQNMTINLVYRTNDPALIEAYGALNYKVHNQVQLYYLDDNSSTVQVDTDTATVDIPNLFHKQLTHDFDGYTANYQITINEAKVALTDGSPLNIRDIMSDTLAYISGSLVITAEDANGRETTLEQGTDYTVAYDGTGNQTDSVGKEIHVLDIVILHPQPVMYTLDYDTTLIIPEHVTESIKYSNSAEITLWGESVKDSAVEKVYADINIAAKSYKVQMFKTSALTGEPLGGATFGLFNAQGGLIATEVTNANGELTFQTSIVEGIILREHILYYLQELNAPTGYQLDDTKHWFCFCDTTEATCKECDELLRGYDAFRIPFEQIGKVSVTNQIMHYDLPATGGSGTYPLILVSIIFIVIPLVYESIRRHKQERRGVG